MTFLSTHRATLSSRIVRPSQELADGDPETRALVPEQVSAHLRTFDTTLNMDRELQASPSHWPLPQATSKHTTYVEGPAAQLHVALDQHVHQEGITTDDLSPFVRSSRPGAALNDGRIPTARLGHASHAPSSYMGQPAADRFPSQQSVFPSPASRPRLHVISTAKHNYEPHDPFPLFNADASLATEPDSPSLLTPLDSMQMILPPDFLASFHAPSSPLDNSCSQKLMSPGPTASHYSLESKRYFLSNLDSFATFHALASLTDSWRLAASQLTCLTFLREDNSTGSEVTLLSIEMLRDVAPGVTALSINVPFSSPPHLRPSSCAPDSWHPPLSYLLIDEGDSALWTPVRMVTTLELLQAAHIRDLRIRNASRATVRHCVKFTDSLHACVLLDDCLHLVDYSDMAQTFFGAAGQYITSDSFVFCSMFLWTLKSLTLGEWMRAHELDLLFGTGCFPRGLETLRVWHSGDGSSTRSSEWLEGRTKLLAYRASGRSCCFGLTRLCLTTTRPLEDMPEPSPGLGNPAGPPVATVVSLELIRDFLEHLHGREVAIWEDVDLELDGVLVSTGGHAGLNL